MRWNMMDQTKQMPDGGRASCPPFEQAQARASSVQAVGRDARPPVGAAKMLRALVIVLMCAGSACVVVTPGGNSICPNVPLDQTTGIIAITQQTGTSSAL